ncbi:hypothetical protein B0H19DRAFT_1108133, partial [Mycena capillaripes]
MDYLGQLREGILEAYTGVQGHREGFVRVTVLFPYIESILELIQCCAMDAQTKLLYVSLIGDLAEALLLKPWISQELRTSTRCYRNEQDPAVGAG